MNGKRKLRGLKALSAIAFLEVFLGHCGVESLAASFGIAIFVIMSGFCLAIEYLPKADTLNLSPVSSIKFGVSKIKKMYPLHVFMAAVIYVIVKMPTSSAAIKRLIAEILLVKCWSADSEVYYAYNCVAWFFAVYLYLCMMAPYVLWIVSKIKNKTQLLISGAVIYAVMLGIGYYVSVVPISIGDDFGKWFTYICPFYRILDFSLGIMLGWLFLHRTDQKAEHEKKNDFLEILALAAFIVMECTHLPVKQNYTGIGRNVYFTLSALLLVWVFAVNGGFLTRFLNNKPLLWLGNLSVSMFLIHQVVIRGIRMYTSRETLGIWYVPYVAVVSFLISVLGAYLYTYLLKLLRRVIP